MDNMNVNDLAQEIRRVDGGHKLGASELAEALMPYLHNVIQDTHLKATEAAWRHAEKEMQ